MSDLCVFSTVSIFGMFRQQAWKQFLPVLFVLMPFSLLLYHLFVGSNWMHQLALFSLWPIFYYSLFLFFHFDHSVCLSVCVCIADTCIVPSNSPRWMQRINFIRALFLRMAPQMSNTIFHQLNGKGAEWTMQSAVWVVNDMVNIYNV